MAENRYELNKQLAQMLKGGVIMDVTTPEQAKIAEAAGACAVMALERIPADICRNSLQRHNCTSTCCLCDFCLLRCCYVHDNSAF